MNKLKIKKEIIIVATTLSVTVLFLSGIHFRSSLGVFIWHNFHTPEIALSLNKEAELALVIGSYYFNVYSDGVYDLEKAQHYFERALEIDPNVPEAWHQIARIHFLEGRFRKAYEETDKQIEIHGNEFMPVYYLRGLISGFQGDFKKAEENFLVFLESSPKNWATHNDLAWIYFSQGEYEQSRGMALKGLSYYPNNPWLHTVLGVSFLNLDRKEEAKEALTLALNEAEQLTPSDWQHAYPGNDPRISESALRKMVETIKFNLNLVVNK